MDHCLVLYRFSEPDQPSYFEQFKTADLSEVKSAIETISGSLISTLTENGIKMLSRAVEMAAQAEVIVRGSNVLFN